MKPTAIIQALSRHLIILFHRRPHYCAILLLLGYLVVFQNHFFTSGDVWAEAYAEYTVNALNPGWAGFFSLGWAKYFNLIPKFLADLYVALHLPLGYIDHYYRLVTMVFALGCSAFIAHPFNRSVIRSDALRLILALATLETLSHVSSFSFINVWYIGFVVVALVSLSQAQMKTRSQILYALFAAAVCLTKPSIVLLPLVIYRLIRQREWYAQGAVAAAILLQTFLMVISLHQNQPHVSALTKAAVILLGTGLLGLKTLNWYPSNLAVVAAASSVIMLLALWLWRRRGLWFAGVIFLPLLLSVYTYFYAPDVRPPLLFNAFQTIFNDQAKLQRELPSYLLILLLLYTATDGLIRYYARGRLGKVLHVRWAALVLAALLVVQYRPIDTTSAAYAADFTQYRADMNAGRSLCVPIAPTPDWARGSSWFFQLNGGCFGINYDQPIALSQLNQLVGPGWAFSVPTSSQKQLKSLLIPIANPEPNRSRRLVLEDQDSKKTFNASVAAKPGGEKLTFVAFNVERTGVQNSRYHFVLREQGSQNSDVKTGIFSNGSAAYYALFMGYPNTGELVH